MQTKPGWLDGVRGERASLQADQRGQTYWTAFELQLIDPAHADAKRGEDRQTGALYSILAPSEPAKLAPPGDWNQGALVVSSTRVEHWVNGVRLVSLDLTAPEFREKLCERYGRRGSTFWVKLEEQLRQPTPIALQNHANSVVRFRNLRIRNLPKP